MHISKSCDWVVLPSPGLDTGVPTKEMDITRPSEDRNLRDVVSILISPICDFDSEAGVEKGKFKLSLASMEVTPLTPGMTLIFEISNLSVHAGIIHQP